MDPIFTEEQLNRMSSKDMLLSRKLNDAPSSRLFYAASDSP